MIIDDVKKHKLNKRIEKFKEIKWVPQITGLTQVYEDLLQGQKLILEKLEELENYLNNVKTK